MSRNIILTSILLLSLGALASSCASVTDRRGTISVDGSFDELVVANNIKVTYTPGAKTSYTIEASDKARERLDMVVRGGSLTIKAEGLNNEVIRINLTSPAVKTYKGMNNAEIHIKGKLDLNRLEAGVYNNSIISFDSPVKVADTDLSGYNNGSIRIGSLAAGSVTASAYNNARIDLGGTATSILYSAYNNAEINADGLKAAHGLANAGNNAIITADVAQLDTQLDTQTSNIARITNRH